VKVVINMKYKNNIQGFIIILLAFTSFMLHAQNFSVSATLEKKLITIGDQIHFNIACDYPKDANIIWPDIYDTLTNGIEILDSVQLDTIDESETQIHLQKSYTITSFDSAIYKIPAFTFKMYFDDDTTVYTKLTDSLQLQVISVEVDTTQAIKDILPPYSEPITFKELLPWIAGGMLLVAIIIYIIYYIRRKRKKEELLTPEKKRISAHIKALNALEKIRKEELWKKEEEKRYYTELTEVIRLYISERYQFDAMEMISSEILYEMQSRIEEELLHKIRNMLTLADMVKFAKVKPLPDEHSKCLTDAFIFVNKTKQEKIDTNEEMNNKTISNKQ